jgi:hypothetical protein
LLHLTTRGFAAWGFRFRFESDDPLLAEVVARLYRDLPVADDAHRVMRAVRGATDGFRVTIESDDGRVEECGQGRRRSSVLELLFWEVNRRALQSMAQRTVLHAAVIGGAAGAIALCGPSHSGKSTLAAAAALRGWRHLSDDMGLVDADALTITPYARPMMLRPGGREHLGDAVAPPAEHLQFFSDDWFVPASELGAVVTDAAVPLVAVGFLGWQQEASLTPITRAETLHDLTRHCGTLAARGEPGFGELHLIAAAVPGFRVGLGAADDVLDLLAPLVHPSTAR